MSRRLLVIDDSQTIRKLVELSCRASSFSIEFAASGAEGLSRAKVNPPDVVLLDLVLPDMKGLEVCQQLLQGPGTSQSAVVLMSAKEEAAIRSQIPGRVAGFLQKPFTAKDLVHKLELAHGRASPQVGPKEPQAVSFERKERLAQLLYTRLKGPLGFIPQWVSELGTAPPASFFARRLLTPELMETLAKDLAGVVGPKAAPEVVGGGRAALAGSTEGFPMLDLLRAIAGRARTGVLELSGQGQRVWLSWRRGVLLLVTTDAVQRYLRGADGELSHVPAEDLSRAVAEQASSGKPVFVSLAESGRLPTGNLSHLLYAHGKRALTEMLDEPRCTFTWSEVPALPLYVEAQGRELTLAQLQLERLRRDQATGSEPGPEVLQWVFERIPGFSRRVRQVELTSEERRVLTLIDGRQPVARVVHRGSMGPALVSAILLRLASVELIRRVDAKPSGRRRVVLIDPDDSGVRSPLERLLGQRREPVDLVALTHDEPQLATTVVKQRPALVIANATVLGDAAHALARELVNSTQGFEGALVAVLEERDPEAGDQLLAAGFDAVLAKPVWFGDLDQFLNG